MKKSHLISNTLSIADLLPFPKSSQSKSFIKEGQSERVNTAPDM
jgi:hypothetical protein